MRRRYNGHVTHLSLFTYYFWLPTYLINIFCIPICTLKVLENPGIDPGTSHMLSERSTIWANPPWDAIIVVTWHIRIYSYSFLVCLICYIEIVSRLLIEWTKFLLSTILKFINSSSSLPTPFKVGNNRNIKFVATKQHIQTPQHLLSKANVVYGETGAINWLQIVLYRI